MGSPTRSAAPRHAARPARVLAALALVAWLGSSPALGQTTQDWTQFQGDGAHAGAASEGVAPPYREAWRFDPELTGRFGVSAPAIAGEVAVTVGPRAVYGVDLATGEAAWTIVRIYGPSAAPAVAATEAGDLLIYTEGYGQAPPDEAYPSATPPPSASPSAAATEPEGGGAPVTSQVMAVDLATQEPAWDAPVLLPAVSRTGVTSDDADTAYVGDDDGTITAIDVATGEVRWTFDAPGPVSTAIAADDGTVVFSTVPVEETPAVVIALAAEDGSELWRLGEDIGPFFASSPAIVGDTVYLRFVDAAGTRLRALALEDGGERWTRTVDPQLSLVSAPIPPVATSETVVALGQSGQVHALSASTGEELWDYAINAPVPRSVPATASATLLVPTNSGSLLAIDTESHDLVSRSAAGGPQGHIGALAVTPTLIVGVKGGHRPGLVAFEHDDGAALLDEPSPTVLAPGVMVANFAIAALPMLAVLWLAGRWLTRRIGPAFVDDDREPAAGPADPDASPETDP